MKPGRKLDRLIAENVLGIYVINGQMFRYVADYKKGEVGTAISCPMPGYSTDIAAAWEVVSAVDLFNEAGTRDYGPAFLAPVEEGWEIARVNGMAANDIEEIATGETPAHVICLAALKLKEEV